MIATLGLLAMSLVPAAFAVSAVAAQQYQVSIDARLNSLNVSVCLAGQGGVLVPHDRAAVRYLVGARSRESGIDLKPTSTQLELAAHDRCVDYTVDLRVAARANPRYRFVDKRNLAVAVAYWLWLPGKMDATGIEVSFALPPGMQVSVPWQALPVTTPGEMRYRVPASPQSDDAVSAFGYFDSCAVAVPGATLRVAALHGRYPGNAGALFEWIARAADGVALAYGRFPNPAPQVLLMPVAERVGDADEPVPFGHVIRDGGEAVQFFVNQQRPLEAFLGDWTATHEFAHLLLPYVGGGEKWIAEGLASYYQNVLMARTGMYSESKAWRKIVAGFRRGEESVPELSLEDAMPRGGWDGIMKTYWGGAAIFLMADVELRRLSGDSVSLDSVLAELQHCCLPSSERWDGATLFAQLDALAGHAVFTPLYERYRAARAFPDYAGLLARLGVDYRDDTVTIDRGAPLAALARSIMAPAAERGTLTASHCTLRP